MLQKGKTNQTSLEFLRTFPQSQVVLPYKFTALNTHERLTNWHPPFWLMKANGLVSSSRLASYNYSSSSYSKVAVAPQKRNIEVPEAAFRQPRTWLQQQRRGNQPA